MVYLSGILALLAVWVLCAFFAEKFDLNASLLPLPVLAGLGVWLCLWGFAGLLQWGGALAYLLALAALAWLLVKKRLAAAAGRLVTPGFVFFAAAGLTFFVLFAVTQPQFIAWDEFTFWGSACKATKLQNALHAAASSNVQARSYNPGMMLLVYFFQFFGKGFSEWSAFFAYDTLFAAAMSAVAALPRRRWATAAVLLAACFALPFFYSAPALGGVSNLYVNVMGDLPLAFVFGGSLCLYLNLHKRRAGWPALAVTLGFLALIKDMGLAYGLIVAGLVCADWLFAKGWPSLKRLGKTLLLGLGLCAPVVGLYLWWIRYYGAVTGGNKATVGSGETGYFDMLAQGFGQLLGLTERTPKFETVSELMAGSLKSVNVCLLGSGVMALALILGLLAVAFLAFPKGKRRRVVQFAVLCGACFGVFLLFHLFLYTFVLKEQEAYQLKDYIRYIGPYYMGWTLAAIGLLSKAAEGGRLQKLTRLTGLGLLAGLCLAIGLRGAPSAGFWNYPHVLYAEREDVAARAAQVNEYLTWDDTVLLISQGDQTVRWNYYGYELNAHLGRGFGGFGYGPGYEQDSNDGWWDTTHMNLVNPVDAGEGKPEVYPYQTVCSPESLYNFLMERRYTHVLVDTSDGYVATTIAGYFGARDLPAQRTDQVYLLKIEYEGDAITWVPVEGCAA